MRFFRSTWMTRIVVAIMVASMTPFLGITVPERSNAHVQHANWLLSHLTGPIGSHTTAAIDTALRTAKAEGSSSLEAYTIAFARAYEEQVASSQTRRASAVSIEQSQLPPLEALFAGTGIDAASLYQHLRFRGMQGAPPAVLLRFQATPSAIAPTGSPRALGLLPETLVLPQATWTLISRLDETTSRSVGCLLSTLWSGQPLGP
jgi:hypothetical protein